MQKNDKYLIKEWMHAYRRLVVILLVIAFLALLFLRVLLAQNIPGEKVWIVLASSILDGLIATIVVSFVIAVTLWWTKPPSDRIPPGFEVPPTDISKELEEAAANTDEWAFLGHTGRDVRNRIFPILRRQSKAHKRQVNVRITILDPRNDKLCKDYAEYRNSVRSSELFHTEWTKEDVQKELIVTIAKTVRLNAEQNNVHCELKYKNFVSQFRFDISDGQIMVTQEDPQEPGFAYPRGSLFFKYYKRESQLIWDLQSKDAKISSIPDPKTSDTQFALQLSGILGNRIEMKIIKSALKRINGDRSLYA
jgi:hypothetical protein